MGEVKFAEIRGEAGVVRFSSNRDAEVAISKMFAHFMQYEHFSNVNSLFHFTELMNGSRFDGRLVDIDYF